MCALEIDLTLSSRKSKHTNGIEQNRAGTEQTQWETNKFVKGTDFGFGIGIGTSAGVVDGHRMRQTKKKTKPI